MVSSSIDITRLPFVYTITNNVENVKLKIQYLNANVILFLKPIEFTLVTFSNTLVLFVCECTLLLSPAAKLHPAV